MLKQPLETAITLYTEDFEDFHVQEGMHIVVDVRDFRAIVVHAETLRTPISAHFSYPTRPLQFAYQDLGMHCEFTLMTTGDYRGASSAPNTRFVSTRSSSRHSSMAPPPAVSRRASDMPPPARPNVSKPLSSQSQRPALRGRVRQPSTTESDPDPESLFMPAGDEDQTWDPPNYDNYEAEEMLGWDANNQRMDASFHATFRDTDTAVRPTQQPAVVENAEGLEPTQRLSQVSNSESAPVS